MILPPKKDHECLGAVADLVNEMVRRRDPTLVALAQQFRSVAEVTAWIRTLPQRDDEGDLLDGPKVAACSPLQRLRLPAPNPNCFERTALWLALVELIDPSRRRSLTTIETSAGPHTLPLQDSKGVALDPLIAENEIEAALFRRDPTPPALTPAESVEWVASIAEEPATALPGGERMVRNARVGMRGMLHGIPITEDQLGDVAFALALAAREARRWGPTGEAVARSVMRALCDLQAQLYAENAEAEAASPPPATTPTPPTPTPTPTAHRNIAPVFAAVGMILQPVISDALSSLVKAAGRMGTKAVHDLGDKGLAAVGVKAAKAGVTPEMIRAVEEELQKEGLTLGQLAKAAPKSGTVAAVTPVGRAARAIDSNS